MNVVITLLDEITAIRLARNAVGDQIVGEEIGQSNVEIVQVGNSSILVESKVSNRDNDLVVE